MEFAFLISTDPSQMPSDLSSPEAQESFAAWMASNQRLVDGGHWISGAGLQTPDTATLVRKQRGVTSVVSDGPLVRLNHAVAVAMADGLQAGLARLSGPLGR